MGNKMKKLICALLASAMLVSSVGMVAFADEETTEETTTVVETVETEEAAEEATEETAEEAEEATEEAAEETAAEATEAPAEAVATEAPVASTGTAYDNDAYYQKALALCSALGIISGYEDGSVKPESKVTRAEMASIVLRMLNTKSMSAYQNVFTDVASSHWAADTIQTAQEAGIVNGMGDGTFAPDGEVTYAQVVVMLVNALNYNQDAVYYGGWQSGYIKVAGDLELLKSAAGSNDVATERGVVIKMVYNALLADYKEIARYENGTAIYESKETLSSAKFDLIEEKGVLMGTEKTSVSGATIQEGFVEILPDDATSSVSYACTLTGLEDYIAQGITYYYKENSGLTPEVLAVTYDASKTDVVEVDADDIESLSGFNNNAGVIKIDGVSKKKDCTDATIIYNGKVVTAAQKAENDMDDLLVPEVGSLKLVDSDKDNTYDIIFVESYETVLVSTTTTEKLTGKVSAATSDDIGATAAYTLNLDDSEDRVVTVTRDGMEVKVRNLKKNDVASIKRSLDNTVVDIVVTGENVTGTVTGVSKKLDATTVTVSGTKYEVANLAVDDIKSGTEAIFYFDQFGRIGYVESVSADGMLQSGEKYGWVIDIYESEDGEDNVVYMLTTDGKAVEMTLGSKLDYWAPGATAATTLSSASEIEDELIGLVSNSDSKKDSCLKVGNYIIRLVKYKASSAGTLSRLYFAVDASSVTDTDALRINTTNLNGKASSSGTVAGYNIADGILEFSVPGSLSDMKDLDNYSIGEVTSSAYVVRENGSSRNYVIGEFDGINPTLLINFTSSATAPEEFTNLDSAGSGPMVMVVSEVSMGVDSDDETVYTIEGVSGGTEVSVTTNKNTIFGDAKNSIWGGTSNRYFQATELWNAAGWTTDSHACSISGLTDSEKGLKEGDILLYSSDGKILIRYASVAAAKFDDDGNFISSSLTSIGANNYSNSTSRVHYYFDKVVDHDLDDVAWVKLNNVSDNITFDPAMAIDLVTIKSNGSVTVDSDTASISDIDEDTDYLFVNIVDKGSAMKSLIIYRFED